MKFFADFNNVLKYLLPLNSLSGQQPLQSKNDNESMKQITEGAVCSGNVSFFINLVKAYFTV